MNERLDPRRSLAPAAVAFALGLVAHVVDQLLYVRAGPVPILVAGPVVASLVAIYVRGAAPPALTLLSLVWGFLASGAAVLLVYLQAVSMELPRPLTGPEMVLYDLGMFCWFVGVLTGGYYLAARSERRLAAVTLLVTPVVQGSYGLLLGVLVSLGVYT